MSNGRVQIELFPGGTLVPTLEVFQACAAGTFEIGSSALPHHQGICPEFGISLFPGGYRSHSDQAAVWYRGLHDFLRESFASQNLHLLSVFQGPSFHLITKKPITAPEQFDGMKIRTVGGLAKLLESFGTKTVAIAPGEIYTAVQLGTVEGTTWGGISTFIQQKLYEVAKYVILDPPIVPFGTTDEVYVNMDAWNKLPDDIKAMFQASADVAYYENGVTFWELDNEAVSILKSKGVEFTVFDEAGKAAMQEHAKIVWDSIAEGGPRAKQAVKILTDYFREMGYTDYKIE